MTDGIKMTLSEAVAVARRCLADHYNLQLINGKMHGHNEAAAAYNKLASQFWYYEKKSSKDDPEQVEEARESK
jgi:hypothetical protein